MPIQVTGSVGLLKYKAGGGSSTGQRLVPQHSCWERLGEHGIQGTHCPVAVSAALCACYQQKEPSLLHPHVSDLNPWLSAVMGLLTPCSAASLAPSYGSDISLKLHLLYSRSLQHSEPSFSESTVDYPPLPMEERHLYGTSEYHFSGRAQNTGSFASDPSV